MMRRTVFLGTGHYVPEKVVTNDDLTRLFDTSDEWIRQRTGVQQRHYVDFDREPLGASDLGTRAARAALADAGVTKDDIDCIVYATLSPDRFFPGDGVLVQAKLDVPAGVPAYDIRNQCSGFLYGLQLADALICQGLYQRVLLIGSEVHSTGIEFANRGRHVTVIFGDGAAAAVLSPSEADDGRGVLATRLHADGRFADALQCAYPSSAEMPRVTEQGVRQGRHWPQMEGRMVFKHAVARMPQVVTELLDEQGAVPADLRLLVCHQANQRISEGVQRKLNLRDDQVFNNIHKYGNTTACSIPLALDEAVKAGRVDRGDLVCLTAFGAGFTWGAALIRW